MPDGTSEPGTDREWSYQEGDVIREQYERFAPGGIPLSKSEYRVKRLLRDESDGARFYYVETEEGGHHLYASAIEDTYEVISIEDSSFESPGQSDTGTEHGGDV